MKSRAKRLFAIRRIIGREEISSQEELEFRLRKSGYKVTQSTLSRDLKELNVVKSTKKNEKSFYFIPDETDEDNTNTAKKKETWHNLTNYVKSIDFSGNISVIKTSPGYASAIASGIDASGTENIIGTIAGYDSVFIVAKENVSHEDFIAELSVIFPGIEKL